MKASQTIPFLIAGVLACSLSPAQLQGTYSSPPVNLPIPQFGSGGAGVCGAGSPNTTEFTMSVPDAFVVSHVRLQLNLTHTYVGDLTLTLRHCGTSVALYDRAPASPSDLSGTYAFDDQASLAFATYVTTVPVVPPNSYLPVNSLSPFFGMSSGGEWTISICDRASGDVGQLNSMSLTLVGALSYGGPVSPPLAIPDGYYGCIAPIARAINVPTPGIVDDLRVTVGLEHAYLQDLEVTIAHDGVVVTLAAHGTVPVGVGVQGLYTFSDGPQIFPTLSSAGSSLPWGSDIPPGSYRPATPLSAFVGHSRQGVWMVTVCDSDLHDVGTLTHASLQLSDSAWDLTLHQPIGPGSIVFTNTGGLPGHTYLNLVTVIPGNFPSGWLNGLDISIADILGQIALGAPIIGTLGSCGEASTWIPGPIPSNLPIQFVSFELDFTGTPVASKRAFEYVTQ